MTHWIIYGASRGLGAAFARALPAAGDTAWLVSRTEPDLSTGDQVRREWIQADVADPGAGARIAAAVQPPHIDVAIYNTGIWEDTAFTDSYRVDAISEAVTRRVIEVNLTAAITCLTAILPQLRQSANPKILLIGSTSGLEHNGGHEVAYNASKFGLRGAAQTLREALRRDEIGVTCVNPGSIGAAYYADGKLARHPREGRDLIPPSDLVALVRCVVNLSRASCVKEIDLAAMQDRV